MKRLAGDRRLDQWNHDREGNNTEQHGVGGLTALQAPDSLVEADNALIGLPESLVYPFHVQVEMIAGDHIVSSCWESIRVMPLATAPASRRVYLSGCGVPAKHQGGSRARDKIRPMGISPTASSVDPQGQAGEQSAANRWRGIG